MQQELPEALHVLDDAEDGFDRGLALGVAGLARARARPVRIERGRCGLIGGSSASRSASGGLCRWRASAMYGSAPAASQRSSLSWL
nr:hypothetical protein [uncultured Thiohalocapsa sp.]